MGIFREQTLKGQKKENTKSSSALLGFCLCVERAVSLAQPA